MSHHDDDRLGARRQRLLHHDAHERAARDLGEQLVGSTHAGRAAGGEHDGGDPAGGGGARVPFPNHSAPTPGGGAAARGPRSPASKRMSTQSNPFSFGERAQPGAPITGRPRAEAMSRRLPGSTGMPKCSMRPPIAAT